MRNKLYYFFLYQRNRIFNLFNFFKFLNYFFNINFNFIDSLCELIPSINIILGYFGTFWGGRSYLNWFTLSKVTNHIFDFINFSVKFILFYFISFQNVDTIFVVINLTLKLLLKLYKLIDLFL
jgi:hypothetical protein